MKETKIAKENVEDVKRVDIQNLEISKLHYLGICSFHKATCQRWLEFLEGRINLNDTRKIIFNEAVVKQDDKILTAKEMINFENRWLGRKVKDLKQAIKIYDEAGI